MTDTGFKDVDREFFQRELDTFLPDRIYDAHAHMWKQDWASFTLGPGIGDVGMAEYDSAIAEIHGGRPTETLFLSFVTPDHRDRIADANAWTAAQIDSRPACRGHFFVTPQDDPEWVRDEVRRLGLHGLKCYHTFADRDPTWEASIPEYLPEPLVAVADDEGWTITLHMVKSRAVADPDNLHWIRKYCRTYPGMQLILAHSSRGFQPAHNLEGLGQRLRSLAYQAIMRLIGSDRLMYGSDLPVSHSRGRVLGAGDNFVWLYEDSPVWGEKHTLVEPVLIGLEHLRLTDQQIEDVFWNNAARLFQLA